MPVVAKGQKAPDWIEVYKLPFINRKSYRCLLCNEFLWNNADFIKHEKKHNKITEV